jgi:hypothetical protein
MTLAKPDFSNLPKFEKNFYLVSLINDWLHFTFCIFQLCDPACFSVPCMSCGAPLPLP